MHCKIIDPHQYKDSIMLLARIMHAGSTYSHINFDDLSFWVVASAPSTIVLGVFDDDDALIGGALLQVQSFYFNFGVSLLQDLAVFIQPGGRSYNALRLLLTEIERIAEARQCQRIVLGITAMLDPTMLGKIYERQGYKLAGSVYVKE